MRGMVIADTSPGGTSLAAGGQEGARRTGGQWNAITSPLEQGVAHAGRAGGGAFLGAQRSVDGLAGDGRRRVLTVGVDLRFELAAELGEEAEHRPHRRVAERADGVAADAVRDGGEQRDVAGLARAAREPAADRAQPARALAAGRALPAGLVRVELHDAGAHRDEVGVLVHDHDAARARHGAQRFSAADVEGHAGTDLDHLDALVGHERVELDGHVELGGVERRHGGAAGDDRLDLLAVGTPPHTSSMSSRKGIPSGSS